MSTRANLPNESPDAEGAREELVDAETSKQVLDAESMPDAEGVKLVCCSRSFS